MLSVVIGALLLLGMGLVVNQSLDTWRIYKQQTDSQINASFAVTRIVEMIHHGERILIPQNSSPRAILAFSLGNTLDANGDGFADSDNDLDGRTNEDASGDVSDDGAPGIIGLDDDNDGSVDEGLANDDDEDGTVDEDPIDGIDNDGDGLVDEDPPADKNNDGQSGIAGLDDDNDTFIDEGTAADDDEDGVADEDGWEIVAYFLSGSDLIERLPNLSPTSGTDYTERVIATRVTAFSVTAISSGTADRFKQIEISLSVENDTGGAYTITTRSRLSAHAARSVGL